MVCVPPRVLRHTSHFFFCKPFIMDDIEIVDTIMKLEQELAEVEDFMKKMEIKDEILELRRKAGMIKPPESPYECEGCSA